jgi:hypothetical protein
MDRLKTIFGYVRLLSFATILSCAYIQNTQAGVKIDVTYNFVEVEVMPRQERIVVPLSTSYTLIGKNQIKQFNSQDGVETIYTLGGTSQGSSVATGEQNTNTFHVIGGALVITSRFPGFIATTRIVTDHKTSCKFTRTFAKIPGHQYFEGTSVSRERKLWSDMHFENVRCSIELIPD